MSGVEALLFRARVLVYPSSSDALWLFDVAGVEVVCVGFIWYAVFVVGCVVGDRNWKSPNERRRNATRPFYEVIHY